MRFSFEVLIKSGNDDVDMDYALKTLAGTSSVVCLLAEAILRGRIIERRTHANDIRARLKHSFKGSFGQKFDIEISDKTLISRLNSIGKPIFAEVMTYYICEALYIEGPEVSVDAQLIIDDLVDIEDELTKRIRSPLKDMHKITNQNGFDVELNYKMRGDGGNVITLNQSTDDLISDTEIEDVRHDINAVITRFNSMTGNGRLIVSGNEDAGTIAFGFYDNLKYVNEAYKLKITQNLHYNNGKGSDEWVYIGLSVNNLTIQSGDVVKYLIRDVE
ncbi:hypothetical protein [Pantoea ananatis]|uniref:hypothetical protein n=1 Tax=Pantoea ananas TaxID=553 RepID=UPI0007630256|nr:hypothetical protein [Pantoea ananatis]AMB76591.1 hypothetical protein AW734_18340 [Pantoea ananatis]